MNDTALSEEQRDLAEVARRFAREKIAPGYMTRERAGVIDRDLVREMGALGLIGADLPEAFGGMGASAVTAGIAIEAVSYGDLNIGYVPLLASLNGQIVARHASPELAAQWLPRLIAGEAMFALALSEPRGGSDAATLQLAAKRDGGDDLLRRWSSPAPGKPGRARGAFPPSWCRWTCRASAAPASATWAAMRSGAVRSSSTMSASPRPSAWPRRGWASCR